MINNLCSIMSLRRIAAVSLILFVLITLNVLAQDISPTESRESEAETIRKCLQDLKSDSTEVRKRAVLILGKYSNPLARKAMIQSLSDTDSGIRRSALVALTERPLTRDAVEPMLKMVGDLDVHIRRIASSYIPEIMRGYRIPRHLQRNLGNLTNWSPELRNIIQQSFHDSDAIVRKNMMTHHHHFRNFLSKETLVKLLNDTDRDVRILALDASSALFRDDKLVETVAILSSDPDPAVRRRLTEILGNARSETAKKILKMLTEDTDFEISTKAYIALFRQPDFSYYAELRKRLDNPQIKSRTLSKIINLFPLMGNKDGADALRELFKHPESTIRKIALKVYGQSFRKDTDADLFVELMNDPSKSIRETAAEVLRQLRKIDVGHVEKLAASPYRDVRDTALTIAAKLSMSDKKIILMELILDEIVDIRLRALGEIIRQKVDGWKLIAQQTLTDDNLEIQQKTITLLQQYQAMASEDVLMDFARKTENPSLRQMILRRYQSRR